MSSIASAYKLQIEKLTNKINQIILENRKLYNFICEAAPSTPSVDTIPGKEQTLSADTGNVQYAAPQQVLPTETQSLNNRPWERDPDWLNPNAMSPEEYLRRLFLLWEWFFRQFGWNNQYDHQHRDWMKQNWERFPYFIPTDANPFGYPPGIPGVYRPGHIAPFGNMTWTQWQEWLRRVYEGQGTNPDGGSLWYPGIPVDVGSQEWWDAVEHMRRVTGNPNWFPVMNPYWLQRWLENGNTWPPQQP
jgi:hypothetical protein